MDYVLNTDGITKTYGNHTVVDHVDMHVKKGDIYGFIGKNGAGKTTFMRIVAGLAAPASGNMELFGSRELEKQRQRIGTLIEHPGLYGSMTAKENLQVARKSYFHFKPNPPDSLDIRFFLTDFCKLLANVADMYLLARLEAVLRRGGENGEGQERIHKTEALEYKNIRIYPEKLLVQVAGQEVSPGSIKSKITACGI